eukprot:COSAG02_NODE_6596_length_3471_cov_1.285884_8_plen_54_part_00
MDTLLAASHSFICVVQCELDPTYTLPVDIPPTTDDRRTVEVEVPNFAFAQRRK